ncbi:hypothetical protein CRG98_018906 [Punica granatum]|uniref:Uncharacterized protein n=1 Tax=Punica granatum TaxID=22663 RepID=A0A2I0JXY9_PUNGR|nr:hypothetical protein CRG98_018906 [Punica granatum]
MAWRGVSMLHFELLTELVDDFVAQVLGVVGDDCRGDSVSSDDVAVRTRMWTLVEACMCAFGSRGLGVSTFLGILDGHT